MPDTNSAIVGSNSKLQRLEQIASGASVSLDSSSLKTKLATFIVAHADKVMDTVAPLESLREELTTAYIEKVQDRLEDPELTPGMIAGMIDNIQQMNLYSLQTLSAVLDADKLQTFIAIDASDNSQNQVNVLNLDSAPSRAKVAKAVASLTKLLQTAGNEEGQANDN